MYAMGGGAGHARRAFNLAARQALDEPVFVAHQASGDWPIPGVGRVGVRPWRERLGPVLPRLECLVVDTFPGGVGHELMGLELPKRAVLVARFVKRDTYVDYDALVARFPELWMPYTESLCEWEECPGAGARVRWLGPVTREIHWKGTCDTLVVGGDLPAEWEDLVGGAEDCRVDGPFTTLPRPNRILALAAGYNLAWELYDPGIPLALRPLQRRFDDQYRRAHLLGTPVYHRDDLVQFLARTEGGHPCC